MSKTVEQYKSELDRLQNEAEQLENLKIPANEEFNEASQKLSDAETLKKSNDFALSSLKNSKIWLLLLAVAVVFDITAVLIALYWQKDIDVHNFAEGFVYNGSPTIFVGMSVVLYLVGGIMAISRIVNKKKLSEQCEKSDVAYIAASKVYDEKKAVYDDISGKIKALENERERVKEEFLTAYPEERKKLNDKKEQEKLAAIEELRRRNEFDAKAAEIARKKMEDKLEADKMFEHPQAYVLDGKFENEYEVFKTAAEMGSEDAQERVVDILLGRAYKNGVKPDVAAGEELAMKYASEGNTKMLEILGRGFLYGEGEMTKNEEKGLKLLERAAVKGRQDAMIMAAICHYNGVGTEPDEQKARSFFAKAAKQGNAQAIKVLAAMDNGQKLRF